MNTIGRTNKSHKIIIKILLYIEIHWGNICGQNLVLKVLPCIIMIHRCTQRRLNNSRYQNNAINCIRKIFVIHFPLLHYSHLMIRSISPKEYFKLFITTIIQNWEVRTIAWYQYRTDKSCYQYNRHHFYWFPRIAALCFSEWWLCLQNLQYNEMEIIQNMIRIIDLNRDT